MNSLNHIFEYDGTPGKYAKQETNKAKDKESISKTSLLGKLEDKKEQVRQIKQEKIENIVRKKTSKDVNL